MSIIRSNSTWIACFFLVGGVSFATTATTYTSCIVAIQAATPGGNNPGAVAFNLSQTDATNCQLQGNSGGSPYYAYSVAASAAGGSVAGGLIGSITTGSLQAANESGLIFPAISNNAEYGNSFFDAIAQSEVESAFTTSGPLRAGTLTFTSDYDVDLENGFSKGSGSITVSQLGQFS